MITRIKKRIITRYVYVKWRTDIPPRDIHPPLFVGSNIAVSSKDLKYITRALQWAEASKLTDSSKRSSSHTARCSKSWRGKMSSSHHSVSPKKGKKTVEKYKTIAFKWQSGQLFADFLCLLRVSNFNPREKRGTTVFAHEREKTVAEFSNWPITWVQLELTRGGPTFVRTHVTL